MRDETSPPWFAYVRIFRINSLRYLREQEQHARREIATAEVRPGAAPGTCISWSRFGSESGAYITDFKNMKQELGARERANAALGVHAIVGISTGWFEEFGDLHDTANHRLYDGFREAMAWMDEAFGNVFAARMDLDERGGGEIDVYALPIHDRKGRPRKDGSRGPNVREISVKSALANLQQKAGGGRSFSAAQTLWAEHARKTLDGRIVRGTPKAITGREHLSVAEYRQSVEAERKAEALRRGMLVTMRSQNENWLELDAGQREREARIDDQERDFERRKAELEREASRHTQKYLDWSLEKYGYESGLTLRYSQLVLEESAVQVRLEAQVKALDEERARLEATRDSDHLAFTERARAAALLETRIGRAAAMLEQALRAQAEDEQRLEAGRRSLERREAEIAVGRQALQRDRDEAATLRANEADYLELRSQSLNHKLQALMLRAAAFQNGMTLISTGSINAQSDIDGRADLAPARDLLASALIATHAAAEAATRDAENKKGEANAATAAAVAAEEAARKARSSLVSVVKSARAIIARIDEVNRPISGPLAEDFAALRRALDALPRRSAPVAGKTSLGHGPIIGFTGW